MTSTATAQKTLLRSRSPVVLLLLLAIVQPAQAQEPDQLRIDSLTAALATSKADTTRLWILNELVWLVWPKDGNTAASEGHNEQLGELARMLKDRGDERTKARVHWYLASYESNAAAIFQHRPPISRSLLHCLACIDLLGHAEDNGMLQGAYQTAYELYKRLGDKAKTIEFLEKSFKLAEVMGDARSKMTYYSWTSGMHSDQGNYPKALEYTGKALEVAEILKDTFAMAMEIGNLSSMHRQMGDMAQARQRADEAVALGRRPGGFLYGPLWLRAGLFMELKDYDAAERDIRELLKGNEENEQLHGELSRVYEGRGDMDMAISEARRAYDLLLLSGNNYPGATMYAAGRLAELYRRQQRYAEALEMMDVQLQWRDSVDNIANVKALERAEYDKELLADSLANHEAIFRAELVHHAEVTREKNRRNIFLFSGIGVLLLAGGLWNRLLYSRRARKEADVLRHRAEASEKFKQQFLANMSHEIRTPMNAIMGMTGILKRNPHSPEQEKYLSAISQSSENLLVILNDILDLSKLEAGKIEMEQVPFDPRAVINNVRDVIRFKAEEKGIAVEITVADDVPPMLLGDPTRLNQILLNLAGNAVKFTEQGRVTVRASVTDLQADRCTLVLDVIDTGIGIPEDRLEKIFEEFTQAYSDTTRKYGGTGLGLTISKRLAELQGGTISVKSDKGRGSTFTVTIPYAVAAEVAKNELQAASSGRAELRDLRILLAEDNDFNAIVAQDELMDAIPGVQVDVAANGRIAVEMVQANDYDVILMDVQMPEMNGYDTTRAIRALFGAKSRVPILAMTANVMKEELERCREAGMDGHIPKPFTREDLMNSIADALPSAS